MSDITTDLVNQLVAFAELPIPADRISVLGSGLASMADLLTQLDSIDLDTNEPPTLFSAEWEE